MINVPDMQEDWIELQTRKYGTVLFNKQTGEIAAPPAGSGTGSGVAVTGDQGEAVSTSTTTTAVSRSKKTKKAERDGTYARHHDREASWGDGDERGDQQVETPQPALRKRKVLELCSFRNGRNVSGVHTF